MPATARRGSGRRSSPAPEVLSSGPWKGVRATADPFDDTPDLLLDAVNMYIPDAKDGSGVYQRPGMALMNSANQLGGPNHQGQCIYHHTALDGTEYRFTAISGKLYRVSSDLTTYTDVTPVGVTIDGGVNTRIFALSFADQLVVSDGVNRPWLGTNLSSTPITGTNIQYDSGNSLWSAQHMTIYSGALLFVIKTIAGVYHQTRIAWSAPNDPTQGYFNTVSGIAVDYTWDLVQTGTTPIYGVCGTNLALLYWRDDSIGGLTGPIGPDFKNSSTHDAIDLKIGTRSPATIALYGNTVFFCDTEGRPQMLPLGNRLVPIWLEMRGVVESSRTDVPQATALTACATLYPSLNLYLAAIWSPAPTSNVSPNTIHAFDALSGQYVGRWSIGGGVNIEAMGVLKDQYGEPELVVIGTKVASITLGFGGYVWRLRNPHENVWTDNGVAMTVQAVTQRLGFAVDVIRYADKASAIVGSADPIALSALTPETLSQSFMVDPRITELSELRVTESGDQRYTESIAQLTATPSSFSLDGTYRVTWGLDSGGRGFILTLAPTQTTSQWKLFKVELTTVASMAPPEED